MNLTHPAVQRLLGLALALEARAESLASPPNPIPAYQRLKETVALEHTSTATELRRLAESIGEPAPALPATITDVLGHCNGVAEEHARMLELLRNVLVLARGNPGEIGDLAQEFGIDVPPRAASLLAYEVSRQLCLEIEALVAEVEAGPAGAPQITESPFAVGALG